ncbi:MAG: hypothetical protein ACK5LP_10735 [Campylobacteraceae bacterium]
MKKVFFALLCCLAMFATAQTKFISETVNAYSKADLAKSDGKLLPTTQVEVLEVKGNKAKVKLSGWMQDGVGSMLYYAKGERIIMAAFAKKSTLDTKVLKTEKDSEGKTDWNAADVVMWIDNKNMVDSIEPLFAKAKSLLEEQCGLCHTYHPTEEFYANQWPATIKGMKDRTSLTTEEMWLVTEYAQKHARK